MKISKSVSIRVILNNKNIKYLKKLMKEQNIVYNNTLRKLLSPEFFLPTREEYDSLLDKISFVKSQIKEINKKLNPMKSGILSLEDITKGFSGESLDENVKRSLETSLIELDLELQELKNKKLEYSINFSENISISRFDLVNLLNGKLSESYLVSGLAQILATSLDRFKTNKKSDGTYTKPISGLPRYRTITRPYGVEFTNICGGVRQNNKKNRYYVKLGKVMTKLRIVDTVPNYLLDNTVWINNYTIKPQGLQSFETGIFELIINYEYDDISSLPNFERKVGVDLGISSTITTSDGEKFSQIDSSKIEKRIEKLQVHLSHKQRENPLYKRSNRYRKLQLLIEKLYARLANRRRYFSHCISKYLTDNYDIITFEDLSVSSMLKNHNLARSISRSTWNQIKIFTEYKAKYKRKIYRNCYKFYPSTKICNKCKEISKQFDSKTQLSIREWICESCGSHNDRDLNAAKNIRVWIPKTNPGQEQKLIQYKRNQLLRDSINFIITANYIEVNYKEKGLFQKSLNLLNLKELTKEEIEFVNSELEKDSKRKNMRYQEATYRIMEMKRMRKVNPYEQKEILKWFEKIYKSIYKKQQVKNNISKKIDLQLKSS